MLVHQFLDYYARNTPDVPCLTQEEVTHTYGEVKDRSVQLANGIKDVIDQHRRQSHGRLVEQQYDRVGHECAAHGQHLLFAAA